MRLVILQKFLLTKDDMFECTVPGRKTTAIIDVSGQGAVLGGFLGVFSHQVEQWLELSFFTTCLPLLYHFMGFYNLRFKYNFGH